jgi:hypothetical protein
MGSEDPSEKANDYAIKALENLLTLASAVLVITITFIKDVVGEKQHAQWKLCIPISWIFLLLAIWLAWVAIADAARQIGTETLTGYAFGPKSGTHYLARTAQWCFLLGLIFLCTFAVKNFLNLL